MYTDISVWYLLHSGYAVKVGSYLLIFDYFFDEPEKNSRTLSSGVINPQEIKDLNVLVFSSHRHPDHFNPIIFDWENQLPNIRYILSRDIPKKYHGHHTVMRPGTVIETDDGIKIRTLKSTDAGVAFLVEMEGLILYHAGDLNWWHWEEESKAWNNNMAARYKKELECLKNEKIDIAFITTDPRQEKQAFWGLEYFLVNIGASYVFPMHFGNDIRIMSEIEELKKANMLFKPVRIIHNRGEEFRLNL